MNAEEAKDDEILEIVKEFWSDGIDNPDCPCDECNYLRQPLLNFAKKLLSTAMIRADDEALVKSMSLNFTVPDRLGSEVVNHKEAFELACYKRKNSNLARSYLELHSLLNTKQAMKNDISGE